MWLVNTKIDLKSFKYVQFLIILCVLNLCRLKNKLWLWTNPISKFTISKYQFYQVKLMITKQKSGSNLAQKLNNTKVYHDLQLFLILATVS